MPEADPLKESSVQSLGDTQLFEVVRRIGACLGVPVSRSVIESVGGESVRSVDELIERLVASAAHTGVLIQETPRLIAGEISAFIDENYPIVLVLDPNPRTTISSIETNFKIFVLERRVGRNLEAAEITKESKSIALSSSELKRLFSLDPAPRKLLCKKELECDTISANKNFHPSKHDHSHGDHHQHSKPLTRYLGLLRLDISDIFTVILFGLVAGILSLATPLVVESLVNVVSWGTYSQPLIVLGLILFVSLGLAGLLNVLQAVIVELIQRRQYVRVVGDLAHRFPRANQRSLEGEYPRELANRMFDLMTIQKASAILLLDGVSIVLTTIIGLVLLGFYHPFLLGFDIVLLILMISVTWMLGRGGIRTAIDESMTKYRTVHWLQDVISSPGVFKMGGGEFLSIHRANQLTADYLNARRRQFRVVVRQMSFAVAVEVIALTSVLAIGGWLVIDGQLTLGQLVASELVITVVVGAFAKAGKSYEKFYDVMAGIDKVGHLIDIPTDARFETYLPINRPAAAAWTTLMFSSTAYSCKVDAATIGAGSRTAIVGNDVDGRSLLVRALAGLTEPTNGTVSIEGLDPTRVLWSSAGRLVGYVGPNDLFHGSLRENIDLDRGGIGYNQVRQAIEIAGLTQLMLHLPLGLETQLQTAGFPLSHLQAKLLVLARAVVAEPSLLIIDGLLDDLPHDDRMQLWSRLTAEGVPWTLVVNTNRDDVAKLCELQLSVRKL